MGFFSHMRDAKSGLAEVSTFACRILTENNKTTQWRTLSQSMKKKKKTSLNTCKCQEWLFLKIAIECYNFICCFPDLASFFNEATSEEPKFKSRMALFCWHSYPEEIWN